MDFLRRWMGSGPPEMKKGAAELEAKEKLKKQVMDQLWDLGESQIENALPLTSLGTDSYFSRDIFEDESAQKIGLHEADEKDRLVDWLNTSDEKLRERLLSSPDAAEKHKGELFAVANRLLELGANSANVTMDALRERMVQGELTGVSVSEKQGLTVVKRGAGSPEKQINLSEPPITSDREAVLNWLVQWHRQATGLVEDLYLLGRPRLDERRADISEFEKLRRDEQLKKLMERTDSADRVNGDIKRNRIAMVEFILKNHGISNDEWRKFLSSH